MRALLTILALASSAVLAAGGDNSTATNVATQANIVAPGETAAMGAIAPSFDCSKATELVEKMICGDPQLARMDAEISRLYKLALTDKQAAPAGHALKVSEEKWLTWRNKCAGDTDPKKCVVWDYAQRAQKLRQGSSVARSEDAKGITDGSVAVRCAGMDALITATFLNADPNVVYFGWGEDGSIFLTQEQSG